jgi:hypothetical protein
VGGETPITLKAALPDIVQFVMLSNSRTFIFDLPAASIARVGSMSLRFSQPVKEQKKIKTMVDARKRLCEKAIFVAMGNIYSL